jgi:hypothetical protein
MQNDLSEAVVLFIGFRSYPMPFSDPARVIQKFGAVRGAELATEVESLLVEQRKIPVDWSRHSLTSAGDMARDYMRARHPELSDEALTALRWKFTYDWK